MVDGSVDGLDKNLDFTSTIIKNLKIFNNNIAIVSAHKIKKNG